MSRPDRATFPCLWPETLSPPSDSRRLCYFDLNHWIGLAKASLRKAPAGDYNELLRACRAAVESRSVRFVLTADLFQEIGKVADPRQRGDLVRVIDEISDFEYLAGLPEIMRRELEATLDGLGAPRPKVRQTTINLVGQSALYAFGRRGGLRIQDATGDVTDRVVAERGTVWLRNLERRSERMLLAGPSDDEVPLLRKSGYRPEIPRRSLENNLTIEQDFARTHLDSHWRKGRLRDVISARELELELGDMLTSELVNRNVSLAEIVDGDRDRIRQLVLSMPSACVRVELKTRYHRDAGKRWEVNDLHDISAMSNAVPYCDIVFTDVQVRAALKGARLDAHMNTRVPRTVSEMAEVLYALARAA